jgi:hypothetical protein
LAGKKNVLVTALDVTNDGSIIAAVKQAEEHFGAIDVLVNNAGYGVYGLLEATSVESIRKQFETNVVGLLAATRAVVPGMRKKCSGVVVNVGSIAGKMVAPATDLPGFTIQSAYRPAKDVGGDFFYVRPGNKGAYQDNRDLTGGVFAVVGDVSGKGLRAALTVSAIMGALRTMPDLEPARILAALNRGLAGQLGGGFVTCCALTIAADGTAILANAGHIPPYRNGQEINVDGGLPLGLAPDLTFPETTIALVPTDRLTLVTDGVLEATNPTTKELFGFYRTAAISTQSAEQIAKAAQQHGQEDDITVLTLTFAPAEVLYV